MTAAALVMLENIKMKTIFVVVVLLLSQNGHFREAGQTGRRK